MENKMNETKIKKVVLEAGIAVTEILRDHTDGNCPHISDIEDCGGFFNESVRHAIAGYLDGSIEPVDSGFPVTSVMVVQASDLFSAILLDWLGAKRLQLVREGNKEALANGNMGVCCSGDHCDSNMAMDEALTDMGYPHASYDDAPKYSESRQLLWNQAWERAKFLEFRNTHTGS